MANLNNSWKYCKRNRNCFLFCVIPSIIGILVILYWFEPKYLIVVSIFALISFGLTTKEDKNKAQYDEIDEYDPVILSGLKVAYVPVGSQVNMKWCINLEIPLRSVNAIVPRVIELYDELAETLIYVLTPDKRCTGLLGTPNMNDKFFNKDICGGTYKLYFGVTKDRKKPEYFGNSILKFTYEIKNEEKHKLYEINLPDYKG